MPVELHGTLYATVAERLKMAHGEKPPPVGIKDISTQVYEVGGIVVVKAVIVFGDGRSFSGHSMVNMNAKGPAERDAPLETCETSAVGRALAMAGYPGSEKGLAGAEEITLAEQRRARYADGSSNVTRVVRSDVGTAAPRPVERGGAVAVAGAGQASQKQIDYATRLLQERQMPPPDDLTTMSSRDISQLIDRLRGSG